jgi:uncharacterized repeat protein (TIGR03803 family)
MGLLWIICALAAMMTAPVAARAASEVVLHNFASPPQGAFPYASVIRDAADNLYGTANSGGTANAGVVYRLDAAGQVTVIHNFTGGADGGFPYAGVIRDSAGNLYGTTSNGGASNTGVVYKLDASGQETVLHNFTGGTDGLSPYAGVTRDSAGNLYGTTTNGGTSNAGVVYKLDAASHETVLYNFTGGADGGHPYAGVIGDSAGNLYGTALDGGTSNAGVVYKLDAAGHETVLYNFTGGADGRYPYAGVIRDSAGNLYGTASWAGSPIAGLVYKLDATGHQTVLYTFTGGDDGGSPRSGVMRDAEGNLYGTTVTGGTGYGGVVYKLDAAGHETVLYNFTRGADGGAPNAGVIRDSAGNFYATTQMGGSAGLGVVCKLDATRHETVLYSFPGPVDGSYPRTGVIRDSAGNLYGTTDNGGTANVGVVYQLSATGRQTVLHTFTGGADGGYPYGGLIRDSTGNLYGTTNQGGAAGVGVVYKLDAAGDETVLYSFTGGADGGYPAAGVIRDSAGNLYGTAGSGGTGGLGVVYKLDVAGHETVLYNFSGGADGGYPYAGVIRDSVGNFYGTTQVGGTGSGGVVYKLDRSGHYTVLYNFTGGSDGGQPVAGVIRDAAGNLYGTAVSGGTGYGGVVYKLDATGHYAVIYNFTGGDDGSGPTGRLIRDSAGTLYGTATGGALGAGVVYKLDAGGHLTVLHAFTGGADGGLPWGGVIRDSAGNLYGTANAYGKRFTGVVFKLEP